MSARPVQSANLGCLATRDAQMACLGALAERYFENDPHTLAIVTAGQFRRVC